MSFFRRDTDERALAFNAKVLDIDARPFPICSERKRDGAQPVSILSNWLVDEYVPVIVLQRKRIFLRSQVENHPAILFSDLDFAKKVVVVGANVGIGGQRGR